MSQICRPACSKKGEKAWSEKIESLRVNVKGLKIPGNITVWNGLLDKLKLIDGERMPEVARNFLYAYIPAVVDEGRVFYTNTEWQTAGLEARRVEETSESSAWLLRENVAMRDAVEALLPPRGKHEDIFYCRSR